MNPKNPPISRTLYISSSNEEQERRRKKEKREREKRIDNLEGRMELQSLTSQLIRNERPRTSSCLRSLVPVQKAENRFLFSSFETRTFTLRDHNSSCDGNTLDLFKKKNSGGTAVTLATPFSKPPPPAVAFHPIDLGYDEARQV